MDKPKSAIQPNRAFECSTVRPPLEAAVVDELTTFWEAAFDADYARFRPVLKGAEADANRNTLYIARAGSSLAGTAQLTVNRAHRRLGGLGEVATVPSMRGCGIGEALSSRASDEFLEQGGEALFLGTVNPVAARLYYRLGWRKLASANVMCLVSAPGSPESFLVDYFRRAAEIQVSLGTAACRVDMIPLIVCPHDSRILDANLGLVSTRYAVQSSCMGLYPRYSTLRDGGEGEWFAAWSVDGRLVGLATARKQADDAVQLDGFAHMQFKSATLPLLHECIRWAVSQGASRCQALLACNDEEKHDVMRSLGFSPAHSGEDVDMDGTAVATQWYTRECPLSQ